MHYLKGIRRIFTRDGREVTVEEAIRLINERRQRESEEQTLVNDRFERRKREKELLNTIKKLVQNPHNVGSQKE